MSVVKDAWFWRMRAAQRDLIARCGGIVRAAKIAEVSDTLIGQCNSPNDDRLLTPRQKARLEADCGDPIVTRAELELLGFSINVNAAPREAATACAHAAHGRVFAETADVARVYAECASDGQYSPADAARSEKELEELARAVEAARLANAALMGKLSS